MVDGPIGVPMVTAALLVEPAHKQGIENAIHLNRPMEAQLVLVIHQKQGSVMKSDVLVFLV